MHDDVAPQERLATAAHHRRRDAQRQWRRLLHALVAYSRLDDDERDRVAWTQLVTIWQVIGRLLRGGQPARVYFCDAAFAPRTARRAEDDTDVDDETTSLLHARPGRLNQGQCFVFSSPRTPERWMPPTTPALYQNPLEHADVAVTPRRWAS
ncbi:hypothetical protein [Pseudonocardia adelaidensis]|uniref:hypothetical protein n=1 Tax=Pseudonocardia adelaidensis TaxID=648754 RepID=UPI0031E4E6F0